MRGSISATGQLRGGGEIEELTHAKLLPVRQLVILRCQQEVPFLGKVAVGNHRLARNHSLTRHQRHAVAHDGRRHDCPGGLQLDGIPIPRDGHGKGLVGHRRKFNGNHQLNSRNRRDDGVLVAGTSCGRWSPFSTVLAFAGWATWRGARLAYCGSTNCACFNFSTRRSASNCSGSSSCGISEMSMSRYDPDRVAMMSRSPRMKVCLTCPYTSR